MSKRKSAPPQTENAESSTIRISPKDYSQLDEEQREEWAPVPPKYERLSPLCIIAGGVFLFCVGIYILATYNAAFADFFNQRISTVFRFIFAKLTNLIPFSVAELLILLIPVILFLSIRYLLKYRCITARSSYMACLGILSIASMMLSAFVLCFATGYKGTTLDEKLGIRSEAVYATELEQTAAYLLDKVNELSPEINYTDSGESTMPYTFSDMNEKLLDAYETFCEKQDFIRTFNSRLKPVMLSKAMSYTHITGVYTYFTGEANINVDFPDYTIPFTAAHELAHQRGIAREDEANMIAFLVCLESDDPYIQYSAYLNVYEYVASALYRADKDKYTSVHGNRLPEVKGEQIAYSNFFAQYTDSAASKVSGAVNDVYLKSQGTQGKKSYGMVVDLTVAYLKHQGLISAESAE